MPEKYSEILSRSWGDIPQPKLLPEGTYLLRVRNVSYFPANEEKNQPERVTFFFEAKEAMDDVDQGELSALGEDYSFSINDIAKQFSLFRPNDWDGVRKLLTLLGVDCSPTKSQAETFSEAKGQEVLGFVKQATFTKKSGESVTQNQPEAFAAV